MPRATDNRKAVGTKHCDTCGTLGRYYQVQKGNRTGYLYYRCECGADQRSGAAVQVQWLKGMSRTDEPMIPHPLEHQAAEPKPEGGEPTAKPAEPLENSEGNPEPESKTTGLIGLFILGTAAAVAMLT